MNKIKESKKIFPCTIYMEKQDYDEEYYYLDTPDYGLAWRPFDDVGSEDIENYNYIIKNITDLRTAIKSLKEDFLYGYGAKYFKLSKNYMEELLNKGETLVHVFNFNVSNKEKVFIIKVEPVQSLKLSLTENYDDTPNKYNLILEDDRILTSAFPEDIKRAIRDYGADDFKDVFGIDGSNITTYKTLTGDKYYALRFYDSEDAELFFRTQTGIGLDEFLESTNSKIENRLAESFEKTIKNLQKEGLFENIKSFDLDFNGKGINIKLNENEDESTYEWGVNFGHNIDDDREDNKDNPNYIAEPDKLFKSEEAAQTACEKYYDANPHSYSEVLHYNEDEGWQVTEEYDGWYD